MLQSMDIRLVSHQIDMHTPMVPLPRHFRIEYLPTLVVNLSRFPQGTRIYDQTVYSLPWLPTNASLLLRSCDPNNYLESFPHPFLSIHRLTIECNFDPWSWEFVIFLRQTFPNTRTLYAIQRDDRDRCAMTIMTSDGRKRGACTLCRLERKPETSDRRSNSNALRYVNADEAYH